MMTSDLLCNPSEVDMIWHINYKLASIILLTNKAEFRLGIEVYVSKVWSFVKAGYKAYMCKNNAASPTIKFADRVTKLGHKVVSSSSLPTNQGACAQSQGHESLSKCVCIVTFLLLWGWGALKFYQQMEEAQLTASMYDNLDGSHWKVWPADTLYSTLNVHIKQCAYTTIKLISRILICAKDEEELRWWHQNEVLSAQASQWRK